MAKTVGTNYFIVLNSTALSIVIYTENYTSLATYNNDLLKYLYGDELKHYILSNAIQRIIAL